MGLLLDIYSLAAGAAFMALLVEIGMILYTVFAIIGLITTIRFFINRKKRKKETAGERWLRTGKID